MAFVDIYTNDLKEQATRKKRTAELDDLLARARVYRENRTPRQEYLDTWAQRISWVYGEMGWNDDDSPRDPHPTTREAIARTLLTHEVGSAFAEQELADAEFRRHCRLAVP